TPEQHEITPAKSGRLLDRELIDRRLDDAEQRRIARGARAERADRFLAERAAARAVADALDRRRELFGKPSRADAIALEHMERHALRALRADAGKAAQRVDEVGEEGRAGGHVRMFEDVSL